jgi:nucleolar protein 12
MNLDVTEDEVRSHFTSCGNIESVRIVRDRKTGISRGIGYVNFIEEDSVSLALELNNTLLKNTKLRVKIYCPNSKGTKRKYEPNDKKKFIKCKDEVIRTEVSFEIKK